MSTIIKIKFLAQPVGLEGYLYVLGYSKWKQTNILSMNEYSNILWVNFYLFTDTFWIEFQALVYIHRVLIWDKKWLSKWMKTILVHTSKFII